jgi:hypothetical protein
MFPWIGATSYLLISFIRNRSRAELAEGFRMCNFKGTRRSRGKVDSLSTGSRSCLNLVFHSRPWGAWAVPY